MSTTKPEVFWIENPEERPKSSVRFAWVFYDRTRTTLKCIRLLACAVNAVLMNLSLTCRRWLVENGLILLGFLTVAMERCEHGGDSQDVGQRPSTWWATGTNEIDLEAKSRRIGHPIMSKLKMKLLYEALVEMLTPLIEYGRRSLEERIKRGGK